MYGINGVVFLLLLAIHGFGPNPNPTRLDSDGQMPALYLQPGKAYRLIVFAPIHPDDHQVNTCNGMSVGRQLWEIDNVLESEPLVATAQPPFKARSQFLDQHNRPVAGGYLCSYKAGLHVPLYTLHLDTGSVVRGMND